MKVIEVCAAVIENNGRYLMATRPEGKSMSGLWEFPGGKIRDGETREECLRREIKEELDVLIEVKDHLYHTEYRYPEKTVSLHFFRCSFTGTKAPEPQEGQDLNWLAPAEMGEIGIPEADREFVEYLKVVKN